MRSSNPALNDKVFKQARGGAAATDAGWAAAQDAYAAPAYRGPVAGDDTLTLNGVVWSSGALIVLLLATAVFGWAITDASATRVEIPGSLPVVALAGAGGATTPILTANPG